jgi:hypothetical protein
MNGKICYKCNEEKLTSEFYKDACKKDGLKGRCKPCSTTYNKSHRLENLASYRTKNKEYYEKNKEVVLARGNAYFIKNKEAIHEQRKGYSKIYRSLNKDKYSIRNRIRRGVKKQVTVKWGILWLNKLRMAETYLIAETLSIVTGIPHEVDHIVPLISKVVCGVHHSNNLRVIPAKENMAKSNKLIEELITL